MAKKKAKPKEAKVEAPATGAVDEGKLWAILSYLFILWIIPLWVIKPRNDFAVYHAKQAFMLFIAWFVLWIISWIPIIGWIIGMIGWIVLFVLWIMGIVKAASNKKEPLPIIGKWAEEGFKSL